MHDRTTLPHRSCSAWCLTTQPTRLINRPSLTPSQIMYKEAAFLLKISCTVNHTTRMHLVRLYGRCYTPAIPAVAQRLTATACTLLAPRRAINTAHWAISSGRDNCPFQLPASDGRQNRYVSDHLSMSVWRSECLSTQGSTLVMERARQIVAEYKDLIPVNSSVEHDL